jgi:hypothetical protein
MVNIIADMSSQEYNIYFRTISQRVDTPDRKCTRGQALFRSWILGGCALSAWLILLLKWTPRNITCIPEPLDVDQTPPIESVLEGRHFSVVGIWGVHTINMAHIIVEMSFQEYNAYFRTISQTVDAPD